MAKSCGDRCSELAGLQAAFAVIVIYLFVLHLLVVAGLILERQGGRQDRDKGFSVRLGYKRGASN